MPTLNEMRQFTAALLGPYSSGTATSGTTTTVLECADFPFTSTLSQDDLYVDQFLYRPAAVAATDAERVVKGYEPSTGLLTPDRAWQGAAYSAGTGETFELHGALSVTAPQQGLHALINQALKRCYVVVEFTFQTASATARRHSLASAASWLTNPDWVRQVGYLASGESRTEVDPFGRVVRGEVTTDGDGVYLEGFSHVTTDTVYVRAVKPAYAHCANAATPAVFDQSGLNAGGDVCVPSVEVVGWATVVEAQMRLGNLLSERGDARVKQNLAVAAALFTKAARAEIRVPPRTFTRLRAWGPVTRP